jgi:hypothetical protein
MYFQLPPDRLNFRIWSVDRAAGLVDVGDHEDHLPADRV